MEVTMAKRFFFACTGVCLLTMSYGLGAHYAAASSVPQAEVAVFSGVLNDGDVIPLPTYADGVPAIEIECHWTVSTAETHSTYPSDGLGAIECRTVGRQVVCNSFDRGSLAYVSGKANYMIIAVRSATPVRVRQESWGNLKARYR
jgi:hypothetical protein